MKDSSCSDKQVLKMTENYTKGGRPLLALGALQSNKRQYS